MHNFTSYAPKFMSHLVQCARENLENNFQTSFTPETTWREKTEIPNGRSKSSQTLAVHQALQQSMEAALTPDAGACDASPGEETHELTLKWWAGVNQVGTGRKKAW